MKKFALCFVFLFPMVAMATDIEVVRPKAKAAWRKDWRISGDFNPATHAESQQKQENCTTAQKTAQIYYQLGCKYLSGRGATRNFQQAAKYFQLSAERGHSSGQVSLGSMYAAGEGVSQDFQQAYFWVSIAAAMDACLVRYRGSLGERLTPQQRKLIDARTKNWLEQFEKNRLD